MTTELEEVIGLEVHAQMNTKTKMFCACSADAFGKPPNTTICPICMGHPGTLPVPNGAAIEKAMRAAVALKCKVQEHCHFDRKHYFYPDLPMGFQISQYDFPLAKGGEVTFDLLDQSGKVCGTHLCRITRLHMENDAGKLTHRGNKTLCDYNRAGSPLMEIVTEPDLHSAEEAVAFAQELRRILIAVDVSEADMFKGMMRFDASVSLREKGSSHLNPRSEIKNLNSFKALDKALTYEGERLCMLWEEQGGPMKNNITVGWLEEEEKTRMLREKETADDYRYFPEPDIPPMHITEEMVRNIQQKLPPLPQIQKEHYRSLGLSERETALLIDTPDLRTLFEAVYEKTNDAKRTSGLILTQLLGFLNAQEKSLGEVPKTSAILELLSFIDDGTISANTGKEVLEEMVRTGNNATEIIRGKNLQQISDRSTLETLVQKAIEANPNAVEAFKNGKQQAFGAIVGWVMKETKGQADPTIVNTLLQKKLKEK